MVAPKAISKDKPSRSLGVLTGGWMLVLGEETSAQRVILCPIEEQMYLRPAATAIG